MKTMKYIAFYNGRVKKWFPRSVNSGKTITTETLCDEVSDSTVSAADVLAVLRSLRSAMTRPSPQTTGSSTTRRSCSATASSGRRSTTCGT